VIATAHGSELISRHLLQRSHCLNAPAWMLGFKQWVVNRFVVLSPYAKRNRFEHIVHDAVDILAHVGCVRIQPHGLVAAAVKRVHPDYFFWTGQSKVQAAASVWRKRLAALFVESKVRDGHSHRFRDTFAVGLLQGGVSIENVAKLLGHASIHVTERHYAPWIKTRQQMLEREIAKVYELGTELD
jgi:integrase